MTEGLSIRPQSLQLAPQYRRLRDTLLRPHLRLTESRYFWERWKPRLGPDAAVLVMEVRDRCNRALAASGTVAADDVSGSFDSAGVNGSANGQASSADGCTVSASELAAACGFSRVTLWRLLQREDVRLFIQVEHNYIYDRRLGKKRRTVSTYRVLMEDPLVEEDQAKLEQLVASGADSVARPVATAQGARPTVQNEILAVDNSPPRFQPATDRGGSIPKPQNVSETIFKERFGKNGLTTRIGAYPVIPRAPQSIVSGVTMTRGASEASGQQSQQSQQRSVPEVDMWRKYPEIAHFVEEAEHLLGDTHSRGFYLKALKLLYPAHMGVWQRAMGVAREQTNIRRSRGALFTRLVRTFAAEVGVEL